MKRYRVLIIGLFTSAVGLFPVGCRSNLYEGDVAGIGARAFAPNGKTPIYQARAVVEDVKREGYYAQTWTDAAGEFVVADVPDGSYRVTVTSRNGLLAAAFEIEVLDGYTPGDIELLLRPVRSNAFVTIAGPYDDMGSVLEELGYLARTMRGEELAATTYPLGFADLLCLNSGVDVALASDPAAVANLKRFVNDGGLLVVSDAAWPFVAAAFPSAVNWGANPAVGTGTQVIPAAVEDSGYRECMGLTTVNVRYTLGNWAVPSSCAGTTYLVGNAVTSEGPKTDVPLLLGFPYGRGYVVYSTFSWRDQLGYGRLAARTLNYFLANY